MKRILSLLLAFVFVIGICASAPITANAATFSDINQSNVFVKQAPNTSTCTLCAAVNMMRRTSMLRGDVNWATITEDSAKSSAWISGTGLAGTFTYSNSSNGISEIKVKSADLPGNSNNTSTLINLLADHPEGIVIFNGTHAVLLTDYTDGVFYCNDPDDQQPYGRVNVSRAYSVKPTNATKYWYVSSPDVYLGGSTPTYNPTLDPATITEGTYYLKNKYTGYYLAVGGDYVSGTRVNEWDKMPENSKVSITSGPNGYIMRFPGVKSAYQSSLDLVVNIHADAPVAGKEISIYTYSGSTSQSWIFQKYNDGYIIRSKYNPNLLLTSGAAKQSIATVEPLIENYNRQIWYLESTTQKYTITYNANGGSNAPSSQTKTHGTNLTLSSTKPTRTGYTFKGWGTSASDTSVDYAPGATYSSNANITLYAIWSPNNYTITYNANGGSNAPSSQTKVHGTNLTLSSDEPTRTGYNFLGWGTSSGDTTVNYAPGDTYSANESKTLYAIWEIITSPLHYRSASEEEVTNLPESQIKVYGEDLILSTQIPKRAGYKFSHWRAISGDKGNFMPGDVYTYNYGTILVAEWVEAETYVIYYDAKGGARAPAPQVKLEGEDIELSRDIPNRPGYEFLGWSTRSYYDELCKDQEKLRYYVDYRRGEHYTQDKDLYLYAVWQCNHDDKELINIKKPTCTKDGYSGDVVCSACRTVLQEGDIIEAKGHNTSVVNTKVATCTAEGYTGDTYCSTCQTTISKGSVIAKKAHNTSVVSAKAATCTAEGYTGDTYCSTCQTTISKGSVIAKKAHNTTVVNAKPATSVTDGYTGDTKCTVCGTITSRGSVIKATGVVDISAFTFKLNEDGKSYAIVDCDNSVTGELVIPSTYNGKPVTVIGNDSIDSCGKITSVVIPDSVEVIGELAFESCYSLKSVEFGKNVKQIKNCAFEDCSSLTSLEFPNGLKEIGGNAFYGCTSLTSVVIPGSVEVFGESIFSNCPSLTKAEFLSGLKETGENLFFGCESLTTVVINEGVKSIGSSSFGYCSSLKSVTIPSTVTRIGEGAFEGCTSIASITIPSGVNSIGFAAFAYCQSLTSITIPSTVTSIGECAFYGCSSLASITIPSSVTSIGRGAFGYKNDTEKVSSFVIKGTTGTSAQKYANENGFSFVSTTGVISLSTPTATSTNTAQGVKISWSAVGYAEKYVVYQRVYNKSTKKYSRWKAIKTTTETSYVDTSVKIGTGYSYAVRAVNGTVKSSYKATKGLTYNVTPTVKIANASTGVKVTWTKAANATGYTVYRSQYNTKTKKWSSWKNMGTAKANKTSWVDRSAKSGVTYKYTVRACNGSAKSKYKASANVLFLAQPKTTVKATSVGINVSWTQSAGAKGYTVYRSELVNGKWSSWKNMGTAKSNQKSWVDKSAQSGATYRYTVRAVNGKYKSSYTASGSVVK